MSVFYFSDTSLIYGLDRDSAEKTRRKEQRSVFKAKDVLKT